MLDIYDVYDHMHKFQIITNIDEFTTQFESGHIYHFSISDHEFIVIYDNNEIIYYVDYYVETGCEDHFRLELTSKRTLIDYFISYLKEDFVTHAEFHRGRKYYREEHINDYYQGKKYSDSSSKFH